MKIAFDVDVIKDLGITRMVHQVAEWGYKYIEQSPHPQINPFYKHPRASREIMAEYKQALRDTGLELSSFICVYRWSGPDELRRQAAVKNWKRLVEIAVEMGVQVINTEFSGDPNQPEICDEMFYRSMEELLPIFEREGIRVEIQAHPWDFCEENNETVDIVKSFQSTRACSGVLASSRVRIAISASDTPPRLLSITARRPVSGRAAVSFSTIRLTISALFCVAIVEAPGSPWMPIPSSA